MGNAPSHATPVEIRSYIKFVLQSNPAQNTEHNRYMSSFMQAQRPLVGGVIRDCKDKGDTLAENLLTLVVQGDATDMEITRLQNEILGRAAQGKKFSLLVDCTAIGTVPAAVVRPMAKFMRENSKAMREYCVGTSIVCTSVLVCGLISMLFMLQPPASEAKVFDTNAQGMAFLEEKWLARFKCPRVGTTRGSRPVY